MCKESPLCSITPASTNKLNLRVLPIYIPLPKHLGQHLYAQLCMNAHNVSIASQQQYINMPIL